MSEINLKIWVQSKQKEKLTSSKTERITKWS